MLTCRPDLKAAEDLFPGSVHLFELPLARNASDGEIWTYAKEHGFAILTADGDDYPPLVWRAAVRRRKSFCWKAGNIRIGLQLT